MRVLFDVFRETLDRHVMRGDLDRVTHAGALTVAVAAVGAALLEVEASPARSAGEAEHRSAPKSPAERASLVASTRTIERMARELRSLRAQAEQLQHLAGRTRDERDDWRDRAEANASVLDLQRRRIETLESLGRIMRAALQEIADSEPGVEAWAPSVFEALKEADASLPDEALVSPVDRAATLTLPAEPNAALEVRTAGDSGVVLTTVREFCEETADTWQCDAVRALLPGDSVSFARGECPVLTITRKAA